MPNTVPRRSARIGQSSKRDDVKPPSSETRKRPQKKQRTGPRVPTPAEMVYLRVNRQLLLQLNAPTANQPNPIPSRPPHGIGGNLNIIAAQLPELQKFAGTTVDWLIRVARFILEPRGSGVLYTYQTQDVQYWLGREKDNTWRQVAAGEELRPTIYEYRRLNDQTMEPTRICHRQVRSVTPNAAQDQASAFLTALLARHPRCIISGEPDPIFLIASHLIPRRLGNDGARSIFQRFTGVPTPVTRYHRSIGVTLEPRMDILVDSFQLGFWNIGNGQYEVHAFFEEDRNIRGLSMMTGNEPNVHRYQITIGSDPPSGIFDWHYIQCVLRRFATEEYQGMDNIAYFVYPFRTRDDGDDSDPEFDDPQNIEDPPYPSYPIDLAFIRRGQQLDEEEHRQGIESWRSDLPA